MDWFAYAILSMILFSAMTLIIKKLMLMGLKASFILLFLFGFAFVFYLAHYFVAKTPAKIDSYIIILLLIVAVLSYLGNLFNLASLELAPNPGYTVAVGSMGMILITVASVFLFHSELSLTKIMGIVLGLIAIILLAL